MRSSQVPLSCLGLAVALACCHHAVAQVPSGEGRVKSAAETPQFRTKTAASVAAARLVPLDSLAPALKERVKKVITQPTLVAHAPPEEFTASLKMYRWLLDHPDRGTFAWQRLGVPCQPIADRGNGRFSWSDDQGSEIVWFPLADGPNVRIWFAEGQVRPAALLPTIPVKAVVVMLYECADAEAPATKIRHEVDVFCHADSRAASLAYRMFGPSSDRIAEQSAEQLLMFFGSLSQYLARHPQHSAQLLAPPAPARAPATNLR